MLTTLLFASASAYTVWEMEEPMEIPLSVPLDGMITYDQLNNALKNTDCTKFVNDQAPTVPANDTCWHYSRPASCGDGGYLKFEKIPLINAKVGAAAVNVDANGKDISMVIGNVTMEVQPSAFTVQAEGLFTLPCTGVLSGVISGAAAAVKGVVDMAAEGVPIIGELAATPIDGVIADVETKLDGLCGLIESVLQGVISMLSDGISEFIQQKLPNIVQQLLQSLVQMAIGSGKGQALLA